MKNLLLVTLIAIISSTSLTIQAMMPIHPDEQRDILICNPLAKSPDLGLQVKLSQGGITGMTQLVVSRYYLGHSTESTYIVQKQASDNRPGQALIYASRDARLTVHATTTPLEDGGNYSTLEVRTNNQIISEKLSCHIVYSIQSSLE